MSVEEVFNRIKAERQKETKGNGFGKYNSVPNHELRITGRKNCGQVMGVFLADSHDVPFREIKGTRSWSIDFKKAKELGMGSLIRVCDINQYKALTIETEEALVKVIDGLKFVEDNWEKVETLGIAKYKPTYKSKTGLIYMKVKNRFDSAGGVVPVEPGVKTIVAETGQLIDSLTTYCDSQIRLMGDGKTFFSEMFGRGAKNTILSLSVVLGDKRYSIAISSVASQSTLTPEDLRIADDLEREWVNVADPLDLDELNKWVKLFEVIRKKVEGDVLKNSVAPQEVPPVQTPQPQAVETDKPVSKAEEDDIFG